MILDPNQRSLYTTALTPPPGYLFDEAIATTYSLDLTTLLTIPVHLALQHIKSQKDALKDGVALLESLNRTSKKITVYAERGRVQLPSQRHLLFGMLESMIVEATAPKGGAFHPKLWLLRFVSPDDPEDVLLRLIISSRNLTTDQSWDLALTLEGRPGKGNLSANRELFDLINALPSLAVHATTKEQRSQSALLASEARRTKWELPEGFDTIKFHALGLNGKKFQIPISNRMGIISPFISKEALEHLWRHTDSIDILISRQESFDSFGNDLSEWTSTCMMLDDVDEPEEESERVDMLGLHAKALILNKGWNTHLFVGSANATTPAMVAGRNVEIMAELVGKKSKVGGVDDIMGTAGIGEYLIPYQIPDEWTEPNRERVLAEQALELAYKMLIKADLHIRCEADNDDWQLTLETSDAIILKGIKSLNIWPISLPYERCVRVDGLQEGKPVKLSSVSIASVTGLIAFKLTSGYPDLSASFVLNLPVAGLPEDRNTAILSSIIRDRKGFLRFILLLLGEYFDDELHTSMAKSDFKSKFKWSSLDTDSMPLLEELTRAYNHDPQRLIKIRQVIEQLSTSEKGREVVPPEFLELWSVFVVAMESQEL